MALATKTGTCPKCQRKDVTLYEQKPRFGGGWECGKCMKK